MKRGSFRFHFIMIVIIIIAKCWLQSSSIFCPPLISVCSTSKESKNNKQTRTSLVVVRHVLCIGSTNTRAIYTFNTKIREKGVWILIEYSCDVSSFSFETYVLRAKQQKNLLCWRLKIAWNGLISIVILLAKCVTYGWRIQVTSNDTLTEFTFDTIHFICLKFDCTIFLRSFRYIGEIVRMIL